MQYRIEKEGALYVVLSNHTGLKQMSSLRRSNCKDWITNNTTVETEDEDANAEA